MTSIKFRALTHNEHKLFFEALGEYGKDFQNIQQYMALKRGKSANKATDQSTGNNNNSSSNNKSTDPQEKREQDKKEDDKKREQIRNFYNKLYGKLSEWFGNLDDRVEKVNQELYLLINYGEIWKKHGFKFKFNNKTKKLLEELLYQGYTSLRFNNRQVRLRTPPCKALKKINEIGIDEKVKVVTARELPKDVIVEFHPATNRDWLRIQSMSQNPRVRAKLSIQKRLSTILEFLENKWNLSPDKLGRTVDTWLKVTPSNQIIHEDTLQTQQSLGQANNNANLNTQNGTLTARADNPPNLTNANSEPSVPVKQTEVRCRLRLKPSAQHELNEVNITRVIPDNHLDLSLNAYIKRLGDSIPKSSESNNKQTNRDPFSNSNNISDGHMMSSENLELSRGAMSTSSRLPISLTTPDSSILFERSMTSDQPSIAQARKHLNILQTLAGSFEGCENSRTACEDTQDRSLPAPPQFDSNRSSTPFGAPRASSSVVGDTNRTTTTESVRTNSTFPALFDEDAAIDTSLPSDNKMSLDRHEPPNENSQNSKSVDFNIPKNLSLGEWFKMANHGSGDEANDAFPTADMSDAFESTSKVEDVCKKEMDESPSVIVTNVDGQESAAPLKSQNHMIEMKKLAEGWTKQDESSMTIGELYLSFKCPERIVLEYEFEQFTYSLQENAEDKPPSVCTTIVPENPPSGNLIFKLLTAASLSLAQIERQKLEQQHKLHDQPLGKLKRRKGPSNPNTIKYLKRDELQQLAAGYKPPAASGAHCESDDIRNNHNQQNQHVDNNNYVNSNVDKNQGQGQAMTLLDIEATNQRVEEALKQLQPTRLSVFRRAR